MKLGAAFALICLLLLPSLGHSYSFPYPDPFYATITAGILKSNHLDKTVTYRDFEVSGNPSRNSVPYFGKSRNKITLRFWEAKPGSPLMIFLSGLGGSSAASYHNFLAYHFVKKGYHVLVLPSALHFQFALAASTSGCPGVSSFDAADIYALAQTALERVKMKRKLQIPSVGLLGVSMGALHAAYLAELDSREKKIGFQQTLLINPPVNPIFGGQALDSLMNSGDSLTGDQKKQLKERLFEFGAQALVLGDILSPSYFENIEARFPTTLEERKYIIGKSLSEFLEALVFTTQQIDDLGVLKNPPATTDPNPRLNEASDFRYSDYLKKILIPCLQKHWKQDYSLEDLVARSNLKGLAGFLQSSASISVHHNADDFILQPGDIEFLQSTFAERSTIYPYGGHVGNLWFPENLEKILSTFESLKK